MWALISKMGKIVGCCRILIQFSTEWEYGQEFILDYHGISAHDLNAIASIYGGKAHVAYKLACECHEEANIIQAYLEK